MIEAVIFDWAGTAVDYGALRRYRHFVKHLHTMMFQLLWKKQENQWEC